MRRRRLLAALTLVVAAAVAAFVLVDVLGAEKGPAEGAPAGGSPVHPSSATTPSPSASSLEPTSSAAGPVADEVTTNAPTWPAELVWPSERTFKADQIEQLGYAPEAIFFGGSRSMRFEPSYLRKKTGLRGFNLAMTNGKPEDAWVFAHLLHERSPETRVRWIWGIQISTMYQRDLEAGLIQDSRLNRFLPLKLLRQQGALLPRDPADVPKEGRVERRKYSRDGVVLWNSYDKAEKNGRTLARSLEVYIKRALEKQKGAVSSSGEKVSRSKDYFEKTLGYLNRVGADPILMAMPVHPQVLKAMRAEGWDERHHRFLSYIDSLHDRYDFVFIDLSEIQSFGGDPSQFYDGVHIKAANARKVIDELARTYPELFGG